MTQQKDYLSQCLSENSKEVTNGKGRNIIPPPEREPLWRGYLRKFTDPLIIVLTVVFFFSVCVTAYEIVCAGKSWQTALEPAGVLVAMLFATGIGFLFEVKAEKEFNLLNTVKNSRLVTVLRRKTPQERPCPMQIRRQDVVVGDIVRLESGDEIPADGQLLNSKDLNVDESNFTGEMHARKTEKEEDFNPDTTYPSNFLLRGSTVIEGYGVMRVTAVGIDTEEGHGALQVREGLQVKTPLNKQLDQLGRWISAASFIVGALIVMGRFVYFFGFDGNAANDTDPLAIIEFALDSLMIAVTLIVMAVPEGLPMSITVSLAMSMRKMLQEKNLVRKLHACETMGAATVICTDKTGTLTQNRMTVVEAHFGPKTPQEIIQRSIAVNTTAELTKHEDGTPHTIGNPTEGALLEWLNASGCSYIPIREETEVVELVPFSTMRKYMATTVREKDGQTITYIKGAPEIVLAQCSTMAEGLTRQEVEAHLAQMQAKAMRTLGFAIKRTLNGKEETVFLGTVAIADPLRDDVSQAINICCHHAGVRVIIVTGDTPATACEIGRQIGLISSTESGQCLTGTEFSALTDEEALRILPRLKVLSRARPNDKARLVGLLQQQGEVVAVTGDGTNDAPALSKAQVGLSMGDGTARAKEASNITIIDNSFASINRAILWGRSLYQNIRRFIIFQVTINVCACLIVLLGAFVGLDSPLTVTQMLWVNLIMDTFAAMALSALPADPRVMEEPPRPTNAHIVDIHMMAFVATWGTLCFAVLLAVWQVLAHEDIGHVSDLFRNYNLDALIADLGKLGNSNVTLKEKGMFFSIFVMMQFWNLFNARYFRTNRRLLSDIADVARGRARFNERFSSIFLSIAAVIAMLQVGIVNFASTMFNVAPLAAIDWLWIFLATSPILLVPELWHILHKKSV